MIRHRTPLEGAWVVEPERLGDERGWFARTFDRAELGFEVVQANASFNAAAGTLRGMHFQRAPHGEPKLVRVTRGAVFDVAVDLETGRWHGVELSADNGLAFFIPAGMAHGFQTLCDDTEVLYLMGHQYVPEAASGVRWDDPAFAIAWPEPPPAGRTISERDASWPLR
jgi:dTDP-4-dehydrorhamnose 3,5-epimerase